LSRVAADVKAKHWFWATGAAWTASALLWIAANSVLPSSLGAPSMVLFSAAVLLLRWSLVGALQARLLPQKRLAWIGITVLGGLLGSAASAAFQNLASAHLATTGMKEGAYPVVKGAAAALEGLVLGWVTAAGLLRPSLKDALLSHGTSLVAALITVYSGLAVLTTPPPSLRPMLNLGPPPPPQIWLVFGASALALLASTWGRPRAWNLAARVMGLLGLGIAVLAPMDLSASGGGWPFLRALPFLLSLLATGAISVIAWKPTPASAPAAL
jgi:hypothetical protein